MIQYNPSRHHQKALSDHVKENSEVKYIKTAKDQEMPQPKTFNRKRKASGICSAEEPSKHRTIVIKKHVPMHTKMLRFLNAHHQASNENTAYELPKYLTESEASKEAGGLKELLF